MQAPYSGQPETLHMLNRHDTKPVSKGGVAIDHLWLKCLYRHCDEYKHNNQPRP